MRTDHSLTLHAASRAMLLLGFLLAGCADTSTLRPAPDSTMVPNDGMSARATAGDVTVIATAGGWRGDVDIEEAVVPLKINIRNNSDRLLRIRYSDFGLVTEEGDRYAALPPYEVEGTVNEPLTAARYGPITRPGFRHSGFSVALHYDGIYRSVRPYTLHQLYFDPYYYSSYYPYWSNNRIRVELPTPEMLRLAVPEGVLDDGGELEGFVYFEKVPADSAGTRVNFHMDLIDATSGDRFATLHIPFVADGS